MKKILFTLISGIIIFALSIFLGIQAIKFIYLKDPIGISLDPSLLSLRAGAWEFTLFVALLLWLGIIYMILTSGSHSKKKKAKMIWKVFLNCLHYVKQKKEQHVSPMIRKNF